MQSNLSLGIFEFYRCFETIQNVRPNLCKGKIKYSLSTYFFNESFVLIFKSPRNVLLFVEKKNDMK